MAIFYNICTDLDIDTLRRKSEIAAKGTQDLWED